MSIPNLWPKDALRVDVVTPLALLRTQASLVSQMTGGLLVGEVISTDGSSGDVQHSLDIVAPALDGYRHRVLTLRHSRDQVYPAIVQWDRPVVPLSGAELRAAVEANKNRTEPVNQARSQERLSALIREALSSPNVVAVIQSLIARSNECLGSSIDDYPAEAGEVTSESGHR